MLQVAVFHVSQEKNLRHSCSKRARIGIKVQKWELSVSPNALQFLRTKRNIGNTAAEQDMRKVAAENVLIKNCGCKYIAVSLYITVL
jgi:hypothetical protein